MVRQQHRFYDSDGPGTLTRILNEPHHRIGHVLLRQRDAARALGIHNPRSQRLGRGSFGSAYEVAIIPGVRSVIKFTRDPSEALASAFLCGKRDPRVVDIYRTWSLNWTHERNLRGWYVVHRAYLHNLSKRDTDLVEVLWRLYNDMEIDLKFPRANNRAMIDKWLNYIRDELEEMQAYTKANVSRTMTLLMEVSQCVHAMHRLGIDWEDIHPGNMMRRDDGTMAIGDVGFGLLHDPVRAHVDNLTTSLAIDYMESLRS